MKNLILILFILSSLSSIGQLRYSSELGIVINSFSNTTFGNSIAPFSYYVNLGAKYQYQSIKFTGDAEFSISNWYSSNIDPNIFFSEYYIQTEFIRIIPGIEIDLGKYFSISTGVYTGIRLNESLKDNSFLFGGFGRTTPSIDSDLTQLFDFGLCYGGKINFSKKVALSLNFNRGLINIINNSISDLDGANFPNEVLKNRNIQIGAEFNLSEYY